MGKIQDTQNFTGKPVNDVYQALLKAASQAGLQVWKRRDIAWLFMVRSGSGSQAIDGNVSARPGCIATVSLSSQGLSDADLHAVANSIFNEIRKGLE